MPILNPNTSTPTVQQDSVQQIAQPLYSGVTVDTKLEPLASLITSIEGSSWIVNYYSQVVDTDNQLSGQAIDTSPVYQQYKLIQKLELKVTTPLTYNQDDESKNVSYTGSANIYPFIIPNTGDMFLADIGGGREGVFQITATSKLSIYKQSAHTIDYRMIEYSTDERRADLTRKVIQTLVYDKNFLLYGQNPLLFESEYELVQYMRLNYKRIAGRYFKSFVSREYKTLVLPGQTYSTYDPYFTKFIKKFFTSDDCLEIQNINELNVDDDECYRATSMLDAVSQRDRSALGDAFLQVGLVDTQLFTNNPTYHGIRWSGIYRAVYPTDPVISVDYSYISTIKVVSDDTFIRVPIKLSPSSLLTMDKVDINQLVSNRVLDGFAQTDTDGNVVDDNAETTAIIHHACQDNYYIFSKAFYENSSTSNDQSLLETLVQSYIDRESFSSTSLKMICDDMVNWNAFDKFYYTPFVLLLMRECMGGFLPT